MSIFEWFFGPLQLSFEALLRQPLSVWLVENRWYLFLGFVTVAAVTKLTIISYLEPPFRWSRVLSGARYIGIAFLALYFSDIISGRVPALAFLEPMFEGTQLSAWIWNIGAVMYAALAFMYLFAYAVTEEDDYL